MAAGLEAAPQTPVGPVALDRPPVGVQQLLLLLQAGGEGPAWERGQSGSVCVCVCVCLCTC